MKTGNSISTMKFVADTKHFMRICSIHRIARALKKQFKHLNLSVSCLLQSVNKQFNPQGSPGSRSRPGLPHMSGPARTAERDRPAASCRTIPKGTPPPAYNRKLPSAAPHGIGSPGAVALKNSKNPIR